jgi:glycosyl transferase, family 25
MRLIDYFERLYIIHLPERTDRYQALSHELAAIGIDITGPKVQLPPPPRPQEANGFPSIGVYSNFIRHLGILKECLKDGVERVWILEDDAIFRRRLRQEVEQDKLIQRLEQNDWDLCYLGHAIEQDALQTYPTGLVPFKGEFLWAHCYCVHARVLPQLVQYFEETLLNPPGHPRGGRLYIDGAFNLFRRFHPDVVTLVSNPNLSSQKGSPSSLANRSWYDRTGAAKPLVTASRLIRDELWRLNS